MPPDSAVAASTRPDPLYAALEERVMARDQKGASEVYYGLVRDGRPLTEMLREAVRIHGPYTHTSLTTSGSTTASSTSSTTTIAS